MEYSLFPQLDFAQLQSELMCYSEDLYYPQDTLTLYNEQQDLFLPSPDPSNSSLSSNESPVSIPLDQFLYPYYDFMAIPQEQQPQPSKPTAKTSFQCDFKGCTKTFTRTYNLKSHRRTHTDEKPFVCDVCNKAFARQHDRNRHAKLHLGIRPFACQFCQKAFVRQDALNRHLKRERNLDLLPPCYLMKVRQEQLELAKKQKKRSLQ